MLTITIQLDPRDKNDTLDLHLEAIGFSRSAATIYKGQTPDLSTAGLAFVENPASDDAEVEKAIIEATILASDDAIGGHLDAGQVELRGTVETGGLQCRHRNPGISRCDQENLCARI